MASYWQSVRRFDRDIWIYLATWALLAFAYFGIQGVLLNLYLLRLGYGPQLIGLLIGAGQLLWAILALPAGAVGLRIGLRNAIVAGHSIVALASALLLLVERFPTEWWSYWLVACWLLMWVGAALNTVNGIPYLAGLTQPDVRPYAFAAQAAVMAFFAFLGSVFAGLLPVLFAQWQGISPDLPSPYRTVLWIAPIFYLAAALTLSRARPVSLKDEEASSGRTSSLPVGVLVFFGITVFLLAASEGAVRAFFNVYLDRGLQVPTAQIGTVMGVAQILPAVAALAAPLFMRRWGAGWTLCLAAVGVALFMLPLGLIPHWSAAALGFMGVIATISIVNPSRSVFSQEIVTPHWRTAASAVLTIGLGLGWAFMAAVGGFIIEGFGFGSLFLLCAALATLDALLLWSFLRTRRAPAPATAGTD